MQVCTTHTGSLPRISEFAHEHTIASVVARQIEIGVDVIGDGEIGKPDYASYVTSRLTGFGDSEGPFLGRGRLDLADYPRYWDKLAALDVAPRTPPVCLGHVNYVGHQALATQLDTLAAAVAGTERADQAGGVFVTAASPGVIARFMPDRHYGDEETYLAALAEAMKVEYEAVIARGFDLQLDCPDLTAGWHVRDGDLTQHRHWVSTRLAALDHATRDIPPERMRLHACWGNYEGPHHHDIPLGDLLDLLLTARPATLAFEGANPRHAHEWAVFTQRRIPEDTMLMPGVVDTTTHYIEHPDLIAQRLAHYADVVGPDRVVGSTDCGFATFAEAPAVDPDIAWAKLASLVEGAARVPRP